MSADQRDLVVLVADENMRAAVEGILGRHQVLGIRPVRSRLLVHPARDPGCLLRAADFLRPFVLSDRHAIVLFDREGCGRESDGREILEASALKRLSASGWEDRAAVVVIDPELEVWVWSDSPHVERCLGWEGRQPSLRDWIRQQGAWPSGHSKPPQPKRLVERALREVRMPRSSTIYTALATSVSVDRCQDAAFQNLRQILVGWFGGG